MSTPAVIHSLISFLLIITTAARATQKLQCTGYAYACGPTLDVHFPFGILQDDRCAYPGFNLSCGTNNASPTLQLPNAGNFTVQGINYLNQQIYISDPAHCFASRLLTFNLSGSPFRAVTQRSFVLFKCPSDLRSGFRSVACLSSENFTVIALAASDAEKSAPEACEEMERVRVPGGWVDYDGLGEGALLQWDWPDCRSCEAADGLCGFKATAGLEVGCSGAPTNGVSTSAKYRLALGLGIPGILCAIALLCCARCKIYCNGPTGHHNHNTALEFSTPQPHVVHAGRGLDQPTIDSYPKTILGQSKRVPKPSADGTCPICLSEYRAKEALRTLPDCNHYFHAHCIDAWLKLNSTCPVCRADTPDRWTSHTTRLIS